MNHLSSDLKLDLKVCEGCGVLWCRAHTHNQPPTGVYCSRCTAVVAELPAPRRVRVRHTRAHTVVPSHSGLQLVGGAR